VHTAALVVADSTALQQGNNECAALHAGCGRRQVQEQGARASE